MLVERIGRSGIIAHGIDVSHTIALADYDSYLPLARRARSTFRPLRVSNNGKHVHPTN